MAASQSANLRASLLFADKYVPCKASMNSLFMSLYDLKGSITQVAIDWPICDYRHFFILLQHSMELQKALFQQLLLR